MDRMKFVGAISIIALLMALPVQAFTADSLTIQVQPTGDAQIQFNYTLNWVEHIAVFLQIADPAKELKNAFESNLKHTVTVKDVTSSSMMMDVNNFASVSVKNGETTLTTPVLSFAEAEHILNRYWFAPLVSPDFSPATTVIVYPDNYTVAYINQDTIPGTSHIIK
jgi:hypothetical protein